jgi:hypothetical protein
MTKSRKKPSTPTNRRRVKNESLNFRLLEWPSGTIRKLTDLLGILVNDSHSSRERKKGEERAPHRQTS